MSTYVLAGTGARGLTNNFTWTNSANTTVCRIYIRDDSYSDAATFKTAMSGVYLVYELATPTQETAEPYASPQIVSPYGTEEYVCETDADVIVPVGHDTMYSTE